MSAPLGQVNSVLKNLRRRIDVGAASKEASKAIIAWLTKHLTKLGNTGNDLGIESGFELKPLTREVDTEEDFNVGGGMVYHSKITSKSVKNPRDYETETADTFSKTEVTFATTDNNPSAGSTCNGMTGNFYTATATPISYIDIETQMNGVTSNSRGDCQAYLNRIVTGTTPIDVYNMAKKAKELVKQGNDVPEITWKDKKFEEEIAKEVSPLEVDKL